jgi:hypothetical protein
MLTDYQRPPISSTFAEHIASAVAGPRRIGAVFCPFKRILLWAQVTA